MSNYKPNIWKPNREIIASIFLILLAAFIWYLSSDFPKLDQAYPGPSLFPRIIAVGLFCIGTIFLSIQINTPKNTGEKYKPGMGKAKIWSLLMGISIVCVFPLISPLLGFISGLMICCFLMGLTFQLQWFKALYVSVITVTLVWIIFSKLLGLPL